MPTIPKVNLILYHESAVAASFHISLIKPAFIALNALASGIDAAVIGALSGAAIEIIPGVDVLTAAGSASRGVAVTFAGQGGDGATCVDD